jgi:hypothetical protein
MKENCIEEYILARRCGLSPVQSQPGQKAGGVAQGVDPKFKPQFPKKKKQKKHTEWLIWQICARKEVSLVVTSGKMEQELSRNGHTGTFWSAANVF